MKQPYVCLERAAINPRAITTAPMHWHPKEQFILYFFQHVYQARLVRVNRKNTRRVYRMFQDGDYLKMERIVYAGDVKEKNWQKKALIAAGHTAEDVIAANVSARLRGEL